MTRPMSEEREKPRKIEVEHVYPPIPIRSWDWRASFADDDPETGLSGWGKTKQEAIAGLLEVHEIECSHCGRYGGEVFACGVGGCPIGADL